MLKVSAAHFRPSTTCTRGIDAHAQLFVVHYVFVCYFSFCSLQTLFEDPDLPGAPALPRGFDLQEFARQVEAEQQEKAKRKRGLFGGS